MEFRQLEHLVAVCSAGSFSGAAKQLRISQPTLSKSIARLEKHLGLKLFDRGGGSARPTVYGHAAAEHSAILLAGVARMSEQLEELARGETGSLRIGVGPATRVKLLPEVVRQVGKTFPELQLQARYDDVQTLMRSLRMGSLDLVFCYFEAPDEQSDFIRVKICDDLRIAVVRPRHPALRQAPLTPEALLKYPITSRCTHSARIRKASSSMSKRAPKALAQRQRRATQPSTPSSASATAANAATQAACCCTQAGAAIAPATSATSTARISVTRFAGPSVVRGSGHW